jgi:hypothetical protein
MSADQTHELHRTFPVSRYTDQTCNDFILRISSLVFSDYCFSALQTVKDWNAYKKQ